MINWCHATAPGIIQAVFCIAFPAALGRVGLRKGNHDSNEHMKRACKTGQTVLFNV